jgi:hypothetical protein
VFLQRSGVLGHVAPPAAVNVELDAPLVVASYQLERAQVTLQAEDGTPVELVERRRLEHGGDFSCSNLNYAFLTPAAPLAPNTQYQMKLHYADDPADIPVGQTLFNDLVLSFVTGTELRSAALPDVTAHVFGANIAQWFGPARSPGRLLELFVETSSLEPLFVLARGKTEAQVRGWYPDFSPPPYQLSLGAVDCAQFTIVDVAGRTLDSERECQPSKCTDAPYGLPDSCSVELLADLSWSDWQLVPDGCGAAPASSPETTPVEVVRHPGSNANGCGLSAPSPTSAWTSSLLCLAAALRRGRRRPAHP